MNAGVRTRNHAKRKRERPESAQASSAAPHAANAGSGQGTKVNGTATMTAVIGYRRPCPTSYARPGPTAAYGSVPASHTFAAACRKEKSDGRPPYTVGWAVHDSHAASAAIPMVTPRRQA